MKTCLYVLLAISLAQVANAQNTPAAPSAISPATPSNPPSGPWLASRGVLSVDEIGALLGAQFSPAERAKLEIVVAERNVTLERVNARLAAQLGQILNQGDAQIASRIEVKAARSVEEERMERLKRLQPSRYKELLRRKRADIKAAPK